MVDYQDPKLWLRVSGGEFNWYQLGKSWRVKPTVLGNAVEAWADLTSEQLEMLANPPLTKRAQNTIATKAKFVDFHMSFQFRCPDARDIFTTAHDDDERVAKVKGACNWGNSGVKIFSPHPGTGFEIQILDSHLADSSVLPASNVKASSGLNDCSSACSGYVPVGQLCGAVYMKHAPLLDATKVAKGWPVPTGSWSDMQLFFRSRRVRSDKTLVSNAELTVMLNGEVTFSGELEGSATSELLPLKDNTWAETGRIFLQEHDNMVEFRKLSITAIETAHAA